MRRKSIPVKIGNVVVGGNNPIVVQSMTNTDTVDVEGVLAEDDRAESIGRVRGDDSVLELGHRQPGAQDTVEIGAVIRSVVFDAENTVLVQ